MQVIKVHVYIATVPHAAHARSRPGWKKGAAMAVARPVHRPIGWQSSAERKAAATARGERKPVAYDLRRWRNMRDAFIATHPLCAVCDRVATEVDHIVPHRGNAALMWDWDNLQSLCKPHHSAKTAAER